LGDCELVMAGASPSQDKWGIAAVSVISVVSARKVDFVENLLRQLQDGSSSITGTRFDPARLRALQSQLVKAVAELDWRLFVTEQELERRELTLGTRLENLDKRMIWIELEKGLESILAPS
jgi:hypothetical protein